MKIKKCCYLDRDCIPACVAYSTAKELSENAKQMGLNDMHCMRLITELASLVNLTNSDYLENEDEF
jgi:hypothetical protein